MKTKVKKNDGKMSIARFVLQEFDTNPKIETEVLIEKVKKLNPKSKFKDTHVAWYKYQIRHGIYQERVKAGTRKELGLLRSVDKKV